MISFKDIAKGYAGVRMSHKDWMFVLRSDAEIFRSQGKHSIARTLDFLAAQHAAIVISNGMVSDPA